MRLSSPIRLAAPLLIAALALAAPASAEVSVTKAKQLCKAAAMNESPAPKRVSFDEGHKAMRAVPGGFVFDIRVSQADGAKVKATCTVDRVAASATIQKPSS